VIYRYFCGTMNSNNKNIALKNGSFMRKIPLVLMLVTGISLSAGDLDTYLALGMVSPQKSVSSEAVDGYGQTTGQLFQPANNLKMLGAGADYTFMGFGDFRLRGNLSFATSVQNPGATLRYLAPGLETEYLEAEGTLKARALGIGVTVVYVSSGAGEYGATLEERRDTLQFQVLQAIQDFPGEVNLVTGRTLSQTHTDPFLSFHATFVQHYENYAVFSRLAYGFGLRGGSAVGAYPAAAFESLDSGLLSVLRPRQELKLSLGLRL